MKAKNVEFHIAVIQIERQLWRAGAAIALVKVLWEYTQTLTDKQRISNFLAAVNDAAWTTAILKTYTLLTDKRSVTIPFLVGEVGANINTRKTPQAPFLSATARASLLMEAKALIRKVKHVKTVRNSEEAHTSPTYDPKIAFLGKHTVEPELWEIYAGCLKIMEGVYKELGHKPPPRAEFEVEIRKDMIKRLVIP